MNLHKKVDALIDWYEKHRPEAGREIRVHATSNTVRKFARKPRNGQYIYRERVIVPLRKTTRERRLGL